ncbi:MAG: carbon starvation CstA family protein [Candidatus Omnitrophica bacterium]|nr:carbon starvation CstA family protein [Candidatus Omnitrophota bacterium]
MISVLVALVIIIFFIAYILYGKFLARHIGLNDNSPTPACKINDGIDYVPARHTLLLGQHFSAIAAAGPIVGPVLACLWFGWLPAFLWIVLGAIFIGGAHDFFALIASVRHNGSSIGEVVKKYMPGKSYKFFLIFVWLALVYVIIAFTDITAHTFKTTIEGANFGPAVALSSVLYLFLAMLMGVLLYKFKMKLAHATLIFLPLLLFIIWAGPHLPQAVLNTFSVFSVKQWDIIILLYCFAASLIPVWLLLQPRGYMGGWFLYLVIVIGLIGALFGGFKIQFPALNTNGFLSAVNGKNIFPLLFITVACGACSGFHGIVSSGTTSKQLKRESDSVPIAYGAMLLEGLVAVLAIATVMMLPKADAILKSDPNLVYAHGIAKYLGLIKVPYEAAFAFALLAFSTFVYDTLDVCTRLARYCLQELMGWTSRKSMYLAGAISVLVPFLFLMMTKEKGYLVAWPIFGTSNQLLASFILLAASSWLLYMGKKIKVVVLPMAFMFIVTLCSLIQLIVPFAQSLFIGRGKFPSGDVTISGVCGILLLILSIMLIFEARQVFVPRKVSQ